MAGGSLSAAQAQQVATSSNVVAGTSTQLAGHVPAMHAANRSISIVVYVNGLYSAKDGHYATGDYAHSKTGARIFNRAFGIYLMDPVSLDWQAHVIAACRAALTRSGADACFLDNLGVAALYPGYNSAVPINRATRKVYTTTAWLTLTGRLAASVAHVKPGSLLISNGLGSGARYFTGPTSRLAAVSPAAMAEVFLRIPSAPLSDFPKPNVWKLNVDMLAAAATDGFRIMAVTKIWRTATAAQLNQWHKYTLATFLLGANSMSALCFTPTQTYAGLGTGDSWAARPIGSPTDRYSAVGAAYQRHFTSGVVFVNPGTAPVTVALPAGTYADVDGTTHTGRITLPAHAGSVLQRR